MRVTVIALPHGLYRRMLAVARSEGLALTEQARRAITVWLEQRGRTRREHGQ